MNDREMSVDRSKQTSIDAGKMALRTVATLALGSIGAGVLELGAKHLLKYRDDRNALRFEMFRKYLSYGLDNEELEKVYQMELDIADVYNILDNMIHDEEDEKAKYYAKLVQYFARNPGTITKSKQVVLTKQFRRLNVFDMHVLESICNGGYAVWNTPDKEVRQSYQRLVSAGIIAPGESGITSLDNPYIDSTDIETYKEILR
jgi:hypothetical protein